MAPVQYHLGQFPPQQVDWTPLMPLIGPANRALAEYNALLRHIPSPHLLLSPLSKQEAVLSSKIEGTNVTTEEVLEFEAGFRDGLPEAKRDDVEEVINYILALRYCESTLAADRPLSLNLLREAHQMLMRGVRGRDKSPGAFRDAQNWIGAPGCTIEEAAFIPIPQEYLPVGLDTWNDYARADDAPDLLIQLALLHLEFEALHPFKDGNGRLGRMLIPLFLFQKQVLTHPSFYMSGYLETNRDAYIETMRAVSRDDDWLGWCRFFLTGIETEANENCRKAGAIADLYRDMLIQVPEVVRSQHANMVVDFLFDTPIFTAPQFAQKTQLRRHNVNRFVNQLREAGIVVPLREAAGRRSALYAFALLLSIVDGR